MKPVASIAWPAALTVAAALAQEYPVKPIRLIVPYPAGASSNDILGRALAQRLSDALGQQVVVDNRPGAGGTLGSDLAAKAVPDGYTLLLGTNGPIAVSPFVYSKLPYAPLRDLAPVTMFAIVPYVLTVNPALPAGNVQELIALAKAKPGQLYYASAGAASTPHLCGEMLKTLAGIDLVHVPYRGGAPATIDTIAGQTQMYCAGFPAVIAQIKAGKLRAIGTAALDRSQLMPGLPTLIEQGLPGFDVNSWNGVLVPVRTPGPVIGRLHEAIARITHSAEFRAYLLQQGAEPIVMGPAEFADYLKGESAKWEKIVRAAGVRVD